MNQLLRKIRVFFITIAVLGFPLGVSAATVTDVYDIPSTTKISTTANHQFSMTLVETWSDSETIQIVFPTGYDLSSLAEDDVDIADDGVDLTTANNCGGTEQASIGIASQTVTLTICAGDSGTIVAGSVVLVEIGTNASASGTGLNRITNPSSVASYFINITGTSGNSGSVIAVTTTNNGPGVSAVVPASSGGSSSGGGGGGGGGASGTVPSSSDEPSSVPEIPSIEETPVSDPEISEETQAPVTDDPVKNDDDQSSTIETVDSTEGTPAQEVVTEGPEVVIPSTTSGGGSDGEINTEEESSGSLPKDENRDDALENSESGVDTAEDVVRPSSTGSLGDVVVDDTEIPQESVSETSLASVLSSIVTTVQDVLQAVRDVPAVHTATTIAVPVAATAAVGTAIVLASSFSLLPYLQWLVTSPLLLVGRRQRKAFGVVYHSLTKVAIELATVRLYDANTNRLVRSTVTDAEGRYTFVAAPGSYRAVVTKGNFIFPSVYLQNAKDDGVFLDVYTGQIIEVTEESAAIAANIPLDPVEVSIQPTAKQLLWRRWLRKMQSFVAFSGVIISVIVVVLAPSFSTAILLGGQIMIFALFWRLARPRPPRGWGIVFNAQNRQPVRNAIVRLFEPKYNKLVETALTDSLGRYSFLVGPNEYFLRYDKDGYQQKIVSPIDYRQKKEPEPLAVDVPLQPNV